MTLSSERPAAVGASASEGLVKELSECLPKKHRPLQGPSRTWGMIDCADLAQKGCNGRTVAAGQSPSRGPTVENRTIAELLSARTNTEEPADEFFI